jgi:hypothetical protein
MKESGGTMSPTEEESSSRAPGRFTKETGREDELMVREHASSLMTVITLFSNMKVAGKMDESTDRAVKSGMMVRLM